jgi:hypothetical protein
MERNSNRKIPFLNIRWADPDSCLAWWKHHGVRATWDAPTLRFMIVEAEVPSRNK